MRKGDVETIAYNRDKGMGITAAQFDAIAADLKKALEQNGAKPADVDVVLKAVEGTRKDIVEGKYDDIPEQAFYMKGTIDEVLQAAEKMKAAA